MNHDSYGEEYIRTILGTVRVIALVGVSLSEVRASNIVMKYLLGKGYDVYPVSPVLKGMTIHGREVFASLKEVPVAIDMVDIFRNSQAAATVVEEALTLNPLPRVIWMQLSVRNDGAAERAEAKGIKVVMNRCPKMEYAKLSGEYAWVGGTSGILSSRRQRLHESGKIQSLGIGAAPKP